MSKRVIAYGAAGLVTLMALVAVYVDHRREPVWLENPPQLGQGPILVGISPGLKEHEGDILMAIAQVNDEAHCTVFSLTTESNAKVVLKWLDTEACGTTRAKPLDVKKHVEGMWDCKNGRAEVQFADLADPQLRYPIIVHALGHVAGLAHDFSGPSVMRDPPPPMGQPAPGLTPQDAGALKGRWCP